VDEVVVYIAPKLVGGAEAPAAIAGVGRGVMAGAVAVQDLTVARVGPDVRLSGRIGDWEWFAQAIR
jgi:diaminohydroxyphosphoribosylaminopyrimidine deaminase/5-amino-6-(5-phosphoribosylamino)uracil reductase